MNNKNVSDKLAKELKSVRDNKVKELKEKISSGAYQVNNKDLVKALLLAS